MTLTPEDFWTRLSEKYAAQPIADPDSYEATLARTQSYLGAGDHVLEIGAGTSSTALRLAPSVTRYVSSDYSAGMTEIGQRQAAGAAIPGLEVVQSGLGDAVLGQGPYDAVLAFNLLHLMPDLHGTARDVAMLLKPGGLFITKTPCLTGTFGVIRIMIGAMRLFGRAPFVNIFSAERLQSEIASAGFEIIEADTYPAKGRNRYIVARKL